MSVINAVPLLAAAGGDYQISRSVRFRSSASAYLQRTPASAGNQKTWTWSGWVKRGKLGSAYCLFGGGLSNVNYFELYFTSDNLYLYDVVSTAQLVTSAVYRDPSAWYHVVATVDTTQATSSNRLKLYVNGVQVTTFSTSVYPAQNANLYINSANVQTIGALNFTSSITDYLDGYLTEVNFIDGQALTPASFGENDSITGVWKPKKYTGTYGTNGFYLNFSDNSAATAAAIGKDSSGNGNNWTPNNISVTAGVTYDSMLDVPTPWGDGGNGRGNYPVWNPLTAGALVTFSEANLKALSTSASAPFNIETTFKTATTGKWYAEVTMAAGASSPAVGIGNNPSTSNSNTDQYAAYRVNATYITTGMGASSTGTPSTFTTNDVIGIAYDADAGTLVFYKNGTLQTGGFTGITAGNYSFVVRKDSVSGDGGYLNCGQRPFTYTPPTGFKALNTQNLPDSTIVKGNKHMDVSLWTGAGQTGAGSITGVGFQPDFVWAKARSFVSSNALYNSIVGGGASKGLSSDLTASEASFNDNATNGYLSSFDANGFSYFGGSTPGYFSANSATYVAWSWKAGGAAVTNNAGSISSQVSANPTAGFSIVSYTGNGASGATIGHGLGVAPKMVITKLRNSAGFQWSVYHSSLASASNYVWLNSTAAQATDATYWGAAPTSSVFTVGTNANTNNSTSPFIAYCFAEVAGFSKIGIYTGNGAADGPFIYCGFRPRYVLVKCSNQAGSWYVFDTSRSAYNVSSIYLGADVPAQEGSLTNIDFLSNGFKLRGNDSAWNASNLSQTYIFMAFAENPFKNALAR